MSQHKIKGLVLQLGKLNRRKRRKKKKTVLPMARRPISAIANNLYFSTFLEMCVFFIFLIFI
jgi:hypothetical protein